MGAVRLPKDELVERRTEQGFVVRVGVDKDRTVTWNAELPTTMSGEFNPWLQMRGKTLKDGFRVSKAGLGWGVYDPVQKFATQRKEKKKIARRELQLRNPRAVADGNCLRATIESGPFWTAFPATIKNDTFLSIEYSG